jgi:hypothetical protein
VFRAADFFGVVLYALNFPQIFELRADIMDSSDSYAEGLLDWDGCKAAKNKPRSLRKSRANL